MCSVNPRFSWQTSTSGNGPLPRGLAWYARSWASSPWKVIGPASIDGSLAGTDNGLRATAGEGDGDAAAAGDGLATGDGPPAVIGVATAAGDGDAAGPAVVPGTGLAAAPVPVAGFSATFV